MSDLLSEKVEQASRLVAESPFDVWITFVRETAESADPVLPFLMDGSLTWQSALLIGKDGRRVAVVGNYDAEPLIDSGHWHEVVPYVQDIRPALLGALEKMALGASPRLAANFSTNDEKCDGLTHGMFLLLEGYLKGSRFEGRLESAESICMALRGRKTPAERARIQDAIAAGDEIFAAIAGYAKVGVSETAVFEEMHRLTDAAHLGYSWDPHQDPIVNSGPNSMIGHGIANPNITLEPGHIFHIDFGVLKDGYASDIQRIWYVRSSAGEAVPADVQRAFDAVRASILAAFERLKPGARGWEIDAIARKTLVGAGYEEYQHALGHQVGRMAHDGGALLGPRWARYGDRPLVPIAEGEVYTVELGVILPERGYLGLEEMVRITAHGCEWLSEPQDSVWVI